MLGNQFDNVKPDNYRTEFDLLRSTGNQPGKTIFPTLDEDDRYKYKTIKFNML